MAMLNNQRVYSMSGLSPSAHPCQQDSAAGAARKTEGQPASIT